VLALPGLVQNTPCTGIEYIPRSYISWSILERATRQEANVSKQSRFKAQLFTSTSDVDRSGEKSKLCTTAESILNTTDVVCMLIARRCCTHAHLIIMRRSRLCGLYYWSRRITLSPCYRRRCERYRDENVRCPLHRQPPLLPSELNRACSH